MGSEKMSKIISKRLVFFLLVFIILLGFLPRFLVILRNCGFIFDEGYNVYQSFLISYKNLLMGNYSDFFSHPFLYYFFLKIWYGFSKNEFFLRLPSVIFGSLGVIGMFFLGKEFFSSRASGLLSALLMSVSFFSLRYSTQVQVVSALLMLEIFILWLYLRACHLKKKKNWLLLALFLVLGFYLDYAILWLWLIINLHFLFLIFNHLVAKKEIKHWFLLNGLFIFFCLPWMPNFFRPAFFNLRWVRYLPLYGFSDWLKSFVLGDDGFYLDYKFPQTSIWVEIFTLIIPVYALFFLVKYLNGLKKEKKGYSRAVFLLILFLLPVLLPGLVPLVSHQQFFYHERNQSFFIIALILSIVASIVLARKKNQLVGGFLISGLFLLFNIINLTHFMSYCPSESWRESALYLKQNMQRKDLVVAHGGFDHFPMLFYLLCQFEYPFEKNQVVLLHFETSEEIKEIYNLINNRRRGQVWLFGLGHEIERFDKGSFWEPFLTKAQEHGFNRRSFSLIEEKEIKAVKLYRGFYNLDLD